LLHGLEVLHIFEAVPHALHEWSAVIGRSTGSLGSTVEWLVHALGSAVAGLVIGAPIAAIVRQLTSHPEELIVD
jgi:hypothetical protein